MKKPTNLDEHLTGPDPGGVGGRPTLFTDKRGEKLSALLVHYAPFPKSLPPPPLPKLQIRPCLKTSPMMKFAALMQQEAIFIFLWQYSLLKQVQSVYFITKSQLYGKQFVVNIRCTQIASKSDTDCFARRHWVCSTKTAEPIMSNHS